MDDFQHASNGTREVKLPMPSAGTRASSTDSTRGT